MVSDVFIENNICIVSVLACVLLTCAYVASLYVWRSKLCRDHPSTIKKRFFSVSCMMLLAPFFVQLFITDATINKGELYAQLGLRWEGLFKALTLPLFLTVILFLGPLTMQFMSGTWKLYTEPLYWFSSWQDLTWIRNHIMAPLSEEWVFRACMMPLLMQCYEPMTAVFFGPLFFGIAHFHHMFEQMKSGYQFKQALMMSTFQFTYTSVFGAYSSYLFLRTGHFVAPVMAHMFCNHMGFPSFSDIGQFPMLQRAIIICNLFLGLGLWCLLLVPITNPEIYDNRLHWET